MLTDLRYSLRSLRKTPGFTAIAITSLALGIGANLAVFEIIDAAILKPLPVARPAELVSLYLQSNKLPGSFTTTSYPEFEFYRDHNTVFSGMLAYLRVPMNIGTGADARQVGGELVSPDYFATLSLHATLGRFLSAADADATVVSYTLWRERFASNPSAIGRRIHIGAGDFTIVGIAPEKFRGIVMDWADPPSVWIPVSQYAAAVPALNLDIVHEWRMESYLVTARLRPGVTLQQAQAQIASLTARLRESRGIRKGESPLLFPVQQARFWPSYRGSILTFLGALMTLVGAVLLIGCCNLASLLLARAANRRREIAIRLAIGAGRARIARQLIVEGLLLSFLGCAAAVVVAAFVSRFLEGFHRPFGIRLAIEPGWNLRVFAFAFSVSIAAGLFFGAAPLLQTWRWGVIDDIRSSAGTRSRLRNIFVVAQVALSTILLAGSALFVHTLANARAQDPTLRPENLLAVELEPGLLGYDNARGARFYSDAVRLAQSVPGVRSAALVYEMPFEGRRSATDIVPPGQPKQQVDFNAVSPGYFETVGVPITRGREFNSRDVEGSPAVAVINEKFAARFWPGENPIGKSFDLTRPPRTVTTVGITTDTKFRSYRDTPRPEFYLPLAQHYLPQATLEIRTAIPASQLAGAIRKQIQTLDPSMPLTDIRTMQARLDDSLSQERLLAGLASGMGTLALVLAAVGIYGVLSFTVSKRRREIGVRMALGARPFEIAGLVIRESAALTVTGLAIGAVGAFVLARLVSKLLYGVEPGDPASFAVAAAVLAAVGVVAAAVPAYRAAAVDPASTLRSE